jgi:hypothetical protein
VHPPAAVHHCYYLNTSAGFQFAAIGPKQGHGRDPTCNAIYSCKHPRRGGGRRALLREGLRRCVADSNTPSQLPAGIFCVLLPGHERLQGLEGQPVDGAGPQILQRMPVLQRAVALVLRKLVLRPLLVVSKHEAVPGDLRGRTGIHYWK